MAKSPPVENLLPQFVGSIKALKASSRHLGLTLGIGGRPLKQLTKQ